MNKTQFAHNGNNVNLYSFDRVETSLNPEYYSVMKSLAGFYLEKKEKFDLPTKIYGKSGFPDRALNTFQKLGKGMSVLLSGPKGTGKTVEAKLICQNSGMPVITITDGYSGAEFSSFIDDITTPSCIFIDEFEKVYFQEVDRNFFLTIMDGVAKSRHLFVLTSNNENIGEFFEGRPGRIRYHKKYDFLEDDVISEILQDRLIYKDNFDSILKELIKIPQLSIDSLVCLIDECNIYNEVPSNFMSFFNISYQRPNYYELSMVGKILRPKKDLKNKREKEDAGYICNNWLSYPNDSYDDRLVELVDCELKSEFARPFSESYLEDDEIGLNPSITANLYAPDCEKPVRLSWVGTDIVKFEQDRKGFVAQHKNGSILKGFAKRSTRAY